MQAVDTGTTRASSSLEIDAQFMCIVEEAHVLPFDVILAFVCVGVAAHEHQAMWSSVSVCEAVQLSVFRHT